MVLEVKQYLARDDRRARGQVHRDCLLWVSFRFLCLTGTKWETVVRKAWSGDDTFHTRHAGLMPDTANARG